VSRSRWNILPPPPDSAAFVSAGYSELLARILFHRGIVHPSQVESFTAADSRLCSDPMQLPGMPQAISRLMTAMMRGENIAVYGDFDTDGVTSTALMVEGLSFLGARATPYIPHRLTEGYGLKSSALEVLAGQGVSLVVSVDCGVTAVEPVKRAAQLGVDVIVTDHHIPSARLPNAVAVVDPKLHGLSHAFSDLSGAGVAFKVLEGLFSTLGREKELDSLLDLVALGTVADVVPLLGENRFLVKQGLKRLNEWPRTGIREMLTVCKLESGCVDTEGISWAIAPRLNSAGRLDHAMPSYRLLTTRSEEEARTLAVWLHQKNIERQDLTTRAMQVARERLGGDVSPAILVGDQAFPVGICGLIAGRLCEELYRPTVVARTGEELSSGSCRSIPEFNIIEAMDRFQSEVGGFIHYGGHAQAAGFTLPTKDLPLLRDFLARLAERQLAGVDLRSGIDIDAEVRLYELGGDVFPSIQKMAPFGEGNRPPVFLSRAVQVVERRTMGKGEHLSLKLKQGGVVWNAVAFGLGSQASGLSDAIDIVYSVEVDRWNGSTRLRLNVIDMESTR
jgi:single-stranded-DNA-specific exonuclease